MRTLTDTGTLWRMAKPFSVHVVGLSCWHAWTASAVGEVCAKCQAHCTRDSSGKIETYTHASERKAHATGNSARSLAA